MQAKAQKVSNVDSFNLIFNLYLIVYYIQIAYLPNLVY